MGCCGHAAGIHAVVPHDTDWVGSRSTPESVSLQLNPYYICDIRGIYGSTFACTRLPTRARQVTDVWHREARTIAYVITT